MRQLMIPLARALLFAGSLWAVAAAAQDAKPPFTKEQIDQLVAPVALYPDSLLSPVKEGEEASPLGPLYGGEKAGQGYHGYRFRILKAQGKEAPGGAYDYVIKGRMVSGFGLVAWPIQYGETGVTTFMVSHDGVLYEKDLGPNTDASARQITHFNPDRSWNKVAESELR